VESTDGSEEEADARADRLYDVFSTVVQEHLIADVPVGLLLSGGLDSSLIAAVAARHASVRTISMGFGESNHDERPFAKIVSDHIGSQHEEMLISPARVTETLANDVWWVDDLFGDWGVISTRLLYKACRDVGIKVVLVGEGSDELFGGYPNFESAGDSGVTSVTRALRLYRWYSGRRWGRELLTVMKSFRELEKEAGGDAFSAVRLFETKHQLPNCYNMKVDKASMSVSVEARVPFLDVRVAREGFSAPKNLLLADGTNKHLLRRMARRQKLLPNAIIDRKKMGGSIAASWMDDVPDFRSFARDIVLDPNSWTATLGLMKPMRAYFDQDQRGLKFPHPLSVLPLVAWRLLLLNLWSRKFLSSV